MLEVRGLHGNKLAYHSSLLLQLTEMAPAAHAEHRVVLSVVHASRASSSFGICGSKSTELEHLGVRHSHRLCRQL